MSHELKIIKSQDDCSEFLGWLQEHPEIAGLQGYTLVRNENARVVAFSYIGSTENYCTGANIAGVSWMWSERRVLNDWIRTMIERAYYA